jgi:hypothetical protein
MSTTKTTRLPALFIEHGLSRWVIFAWDDPEESIDNALCL